MYKKSSQCIIHMYSLRFGIRYVFQLSDDVFFFLRCFVDSFLFCIPIRFSVDFCCFSFLFPRHSFLVGFGLVFGWHFFLLSLLNTVFNGANVYNRCAYGPMRYNLTENIARICCCVNFYLIFFPVDVCIFNRWLFLHAFQHSRAVCIAKKGALYTLTIHYMVLFDY